MRGKEWILRTGMTFEMYGSRASVLELRYGAGSLAWIR